MSEIHFQPTFHTIEDIYEVQLDTDRGVKEKIRIFDTAGVVRSFSYFLPMFYPNCYLTIIRVLRAQAL